MGRRIGCLEALTLFDRVLQEIHSHSYAVNHHLRMNESTVLLKVTVIVSWFWQSIHGVESHLELAPWKSAFGDLFNTIDGHVASSKDYLESLNIDTIAAASEIAMNAFTELCRQIARVTHDLPEINTACGWLITNRYVRIMTPEFAHPHCGPAEHAILCLIKFARSAIRAAVRDGQDPLSAFPCHIDLSWLLFDKASESCAALRALFRRRVILKTFGPFDHIRHETLTSSYLYIALPLSLAEGLSSGLGARIPFPLGQLNAMYSIKSAIRKLAHWYRQNCLTPEQIEEEAAFICFRPIIAMTSTDLKHPSGRGGFQRYHNCSYIGFSWCFSIDSDPSLNYGLPEWSRRTSIVFVAKGISVKKIVNIVHAASYVYHSPSEGIPPLALLDNDCFEISAKAMKAKPLDWN
ncbi:unnamed protein product [Symbiodinium necroappetens]|uniref:Uncharacterized protein n=1 Tax=Symbiodinium necroappetens TaxID=1628268 RepID=A0A812ZP33_9DINO|nr:unnamed protein product [Symbiodinium necroappetens]